MLPVDESYLRSEFIDWVIEAIEAERLPKQDELFSYFIQHLERIGVVAVSRETEQYYLTQQRDTYDEE